VISGVQQNAAVPDSVKQQASTQLVGGVPFLSDKQLTEALDRAGVTGEETSEILRINADARLEALRVAFGLTAVLAVAALFFTGGVPRHSPGSGGGTSSSASPRKGRRPPSAGARARP
jgi:hypothetical protein